MDWIQLFHGKASTTDRYQKAALNFNFFFSQQPITAVVSGKISFHPDHVWKNSVQIQSSNVMDMVVATTMINWHHSG